MAWPLITIRMLNGLKQKEMQTERRNRENGKRYGIESKKSDQKHPKQK